LARMWHGAGSRPLKIKGQSRETTADLRGKLCALERESNAPTLLIRRVPAVA